MSRLTFASDPETYTEDTVTTKQLFAALMALMVRMERIELIAGNLSNILLSLAAESVPPQDKWDAACDMLEEFLGDLKEEIAVHHEVREHLDFLHEPE